MSKPEEENQNNAFNTLLVISPCLLSLLIILRVGIVWVVPAAVVLGLIVFRLATSKRQKIAVVISYIVPALLLVAITFGYQIGKSMALRDNSTCAIVSKY